MQTHRAVTEARALRRFPAGIVAALGQAALFFAATVTPDNVFRMGEDPALYTGELVVSLPVAVFTVIFFKNRNGGAGV